VDGLKAELSASQTREREMKDQLDRLQDRDHRRDVKERIARFSAMGLDRLPGFLRRAEQIMDADDGAPVVESVTLSVPGSEEGETKDEQRTDMTLTDAVEALVETLPMKDDKVDFSAMVEQPALDEDENDPRRPSEQERQASSQHDDDPGKVKERADAVSAELGVGVDSGTSGGEES